MKRYFRLELCLLCSQLIAVQAMFLLALHGSMEFERTIGSAHKMTHLSWWVIHHHARFFGSVGLIFALLYLVCFSAKDLSGAGRRYVLLSLSVLFVVASATVVAYLMVLTADAPLVGVGEKVET
jgi:hypothetical protein